jgi:hypothetical protein
LDNLRLPRYGQAKAKVIDKQSSGISLGILPLNFKECPHAEAYRPGMHLKQRVFPHQKRMIMSAAPIMAKFLSGALIRVAVARIRAQGRVPGNPDRISIPGEPAAGPNATWC